MRMWIGYLPIRIFGSYRDRVRSSLGAVYLRFAMTRDVGEGEKGFLVLVALKMPRAPTEAPARPYESDASRARRRHHPRLGRQGTQS